MNMQQLIEKYFTRDSMVELLTQYELYYQISLGNFIYETLQDLEETNEKIKELNLQPTPSTMLSNIYEMIIHMSHKEDFEKRFEYFIRYRATLQALKDFVNSDKDLMQVDDYIEEKSNLIVDDKLFNEQMYLQYESSYSNIHDYFDILITEDIVTALANELLKDN